MTKQTDCPNCGYPDTIDGQHFKGIHDPYVNCPHCNYLVTPDPRTAFHVAACREEDQRFTDEIDVAAEKVKKFVEEKLREQLKGFIGVSNTENNRDALEAKAREHLFDLRSKSLTPKAIEILLGEGEEP